MNGKTKSSHGGRLSSFEAVRIVAILMVLVVHCVRNKFEVTDPHTLAIECGWLSWEECVMASFGILGVNLFILISGWFGIRLSARGVFGIFFRNYFLPAAYRNRLPECGSRPGQGIPIVYCSDVSRLVFGGLRIADVYHSDDKPLY